MIDVVPLGGLGEIGLNTMGVAHGGERLLIDCGLMFPRVDQLGVDVVVPDFRWVRETPEALKAVVLTHAHEDHLGALPWLLRELSVPVYGTRFTLAVARHKLDEAGIRADLREMAPRERFRIGTHFVVEAIRVTHSVPDAVALAVTTPTGTVVHTGDFKLDGMPIDGHLTDLERFGELGERGVDVLLSDSTNAEVAGTTGSEQLVRDTFERLIGGATQRVIVALFGSHLHRVHALLQLAQRFGRRAVLGGRSLQRNVDLARDAGILPVPDDLLVRWDDAGEVPPQKQLVICTGAQAEPQSALARLAEGGPGPLRIDAGDTVVLSSRTIPGNEVAVSTLVNRLLARGARVAYAAIEPGVHVSGHAAQDEQRRLIEVVRPTHFVPIHGELRHLLRHRELARRCGLDDDHTSVMTDGDAMRFSEGRAIVLPPVATGHLLTRRDGFGTITEEALAQRRAVATDGVVICAVALPVGGAQLLSGPSVTARGLHGDDLAALALCADGARLALSELPSEAGHDDERVREALIRGIRRVFKQLLGTRPQVVPVVLRVPAGIKG